LLCFYVTKTILLPEIIQYQLQNPASANVTEAGFLIYKQFNDGFCLAQYPYVTQIGFDLFEKDYCPRKSGVINRFLVDNPKYNVMIWLTHTREFESKMMTYFRDELAGARFDFLALLVSANEIQAFAQDDVELRIVRTESTFPEQTKDIRERLDRASQKVTGCFSEDLMSVLEAVHMD